MSGRLEILPLSRPIDASVVLPGSKSITNRALILAALADGHSVLRGALFSDDTRYMAQSLRMLGLKVAQDFTAGIIEVDGTGGEILNSSAELYIGNAGTAARFLTAYLALGHGEYRLDGVERMRQRPIMDLLDALAHLGGNARSVLGTGCPPIEVHADGLKGGNCRMRGSASSQYLTALLQIAPYTREGITIEIEGELVSRPYVDITLRMMEAWGVKGSNTNYQRFSVSGGRTYSAQEYWIEPDASSASYFYAAAAITGGKISTPGLGADSIQGDIRFVDALERMGCQVERDPDCVTVIGPESLQGIEIDMNDISDTVMTLAAIAPLADSPTTISNVAHIRHKETDRITALATELTRIGVKVEEREYGLTIHPVDRITPATVQTYEDHRMAMSFAILGLRAKGISIENPDCVAKTFPDFFRTLEIACESAR